MADPRSTPDPVRDPGPTDVDKLIARYDEELPARRLTGRLSAAVTLACFAISLFVLRQVFAPLAYGNQFYLILFLGFVLPLVFICYKPRLRRDPGVADRPGVLDWVLAAVALVVCLYPVLPFQIGESGGGFDAFLDRQGSLTPLDVAMGGVLLVLVIEATRRTTGWVLPAVCVGFLLYAYYGGFIPRSIPGSHAGIDFSQIVNALYNDATGFYGVPLDVCATYIVLFTIYGAVLDRTGAGQFFVELSFAAFRGSRTAPGRTVAMSGFLLGTVSGSGTATAVSIGSVTWPVLNRAGYPRDKAGGMLAASGIGAILSPPTMGAAAFIIAEYLRTSYLSVLLWAMVPTLLYYLGIFLAIEIDARRAGVRSVDVAARNPWRLLARYGYHFVSLGVIVVFLALGIPPFRAVVYAICVAAAFGLLESLLAGPGPSARRLGGYGVLLYEALASGVRSVLPVASVCAAAGIIVSTITKTGLGQELADLLITTARALTSNETAVLVLTVVFAAVAISVLGLAVPVTASFIISWVIIGPALLGLGVPPPAAAMFIFYYAVLSEVTPPTALAAVASAAITGGQVIATMMQALKYSLPAFLVPMAFVLTGNGGFLLWQGTVWQGLWAFLVSAVAVAALAAVTGAWIAGPARWPERVLCALGALFLLYLQPASMVAGGCLLAAAVAVHLVLRTDAGHLGVSRRLTHLVGRPRDQADRKEGNHGEISQ
jgi:TRAP transporter 4TM/12TM fusion protein